MQQPNEWTLAEAAAYNGVSVRTVQRWIQQGHLTSRSEPNLRGRPRQYVNAAEAAKVGGKMFQRNLDTRY